MPLYKNNKKLVELVNKELRRMIDDFSSNDDKLEDYWDYRNDQYEFKLWSREIARLHADIVEEERLEKRK